MTETEFFGSPFLRGGVAEGGARTAQQPESAEASSPQRAEPREAEEAEESASAAASASTASIAAAAAETKASDAHKTTAPSSKSAAPPEAQEETRTEKHKPQGDCVVCGHLAKNFCASCKHVFYCDR